MIKRVNGKDFFSAPHGRAVWTAVLLVIFFAAPVRPNHTVNEDTFIRILRAEDERRYDHALLALLSHQNVEVRRRAALAAGRIGDAAALRPLMTLLANDSEPDVRATAAFALGEIESTEAVEALTEALHRAGETAPIRARSVEALGKIAAANLTSGDQARVLPLVSEIERVLEQEGPAGEREVALAALTASLRARMIDAGPTIAALLTHRDERVRSDAANTLARLRVKNVNTQLEAALADAGPVVRANVAQALGRAGDHAAYN
ncbi:MAG: HEAT repeat domain-containing protein, partial [Pyrinomonadaceae bacterium]|nr:HEAT repeat domain-containing protein [Pyrinomonadaceae bacterium]